jgi:hypothetical protein
MMNDKFSTFSAIHRQRRCGVLCFLDSSTNYPFLISPEALPQNSLQHPFVVEDQLFDFLSSSVEPSFCYGHAAALPFAKACKFRTVLSRQIVRLYAALCRPIGCSFVTGQIPERFVATSC